MSSGVIPAACRELIHILNQRYRIAWDRAERLQAELDDIKGSRAWVIFRLLRAVRRCLLPTFRRRPVAAARNEIALTAEREPRLAVSHKVSILIPFKDHLSLLRNCLRSLRRGTYRRLEIVLLDNGSTSPEMQRYLRHMAGRRGFQVVLCPGPFNFARMCNQGAAAARGDYLLFLNNDVEVLTPDWLEQMLTVAEQPRIGIVGAILLYPDGTIQHAGIEPAPDGEWRHIARGLDWESSRADTLRVVSGVTGACLLMRRDRFLELGGFDERFPVTENDVDLCLRARRRGWLTVVSSAARLVHFESLTRGYARQP
jgi:GT2 family glycosyltransferase